MATEHITKKLAELRTKLRRLIITIGVLRVVLLTSAAVAAVFILDWLNHLPAVTRISLAVAVLGVALVAVYQFLIRPLSVSLTDDSLALLVEKHHPEFKDRLISAVQLVRNRNVRLHSPRLVEQVVSDADDLAQTADFAEVVQNAQMKRYLLGAALCLLLAGAYTTMYSGTVGIFFARMLKPYSGPEWPRRNTIVLKNRETLSYLAKGDDLTLEAECKGPMPSQVTVYYKFSSMSGKMPMKYVSGDDFKAHFADVNEDLAFYIQGGDDKTEVYQVKVIDRPRVETITISYDFPEYTGLAGYPQTAGQGYISGVEGTKVHLKGRTNKRIESNGAKIVFDNEQEIPLTVQSQSTSEGGSAFTGDFVLEPGPNSYRIEVTDLEGLTDSNPVTYRLRVLQDNAPAVKVTEPKGNREMTAKAALPVTVEAVDEKDFGGIREVRFAMSKGGEDESERTEITEPFADVEPHQFTVQTSGEWELARLAPKEGDVIACHAEAEDYNNVTGPGIGKSETVYITIISEAQLVARLNEEMEKAKDRVENIRKVQAQLKDTSMQLAEKLNRQGDLDAQEAQTLNSSVQQQKELARQAKEAGKTFAAIARELALNKVATPEDMQRLESFEKMLEEVGNSKMKPAGAKLEAARNAEAKEEPIRQAADLQVQAVDDLDELLKRFGKTEGLDELIRLASELAIKQKSINERSRSVSIRTLGQTPEETAEEDRAAMRSLERDQSSAHEAMKNLEAAMSRYIDKVKQAEPKAAEGVQQALSQAADDQIRRKMRDAADDLGKMSPASAVPLQEEVYTDLQKLVESLRDVLRRLYAERRDLKQELEREARRLEQLIQDQQNLKRMSEPGHREALEKARQTIEKMLQKQQDLNRQTQQRIEQGGNISDLADEQQSLEKELEQQHEQVQKASPSAGRHAGEATMNMQKAENNLEQNQAGFAESFQKKAEQNLKDALDQLDKEIEKAEAQDLAEQQENLRQRAQELSNSLDELGKQSEPLGRELPQRLEDAAQRTQQAQNQMKDAAANISKQQKEQANTEQDQALKKLQEAKERLESILGELAQKERAKKLFEIGKALAEMLGKQREVNNETVQVAEIQKAEGNLPRTWLMKLRQTTDKQIDLQNNADEVLKKLEEENSVVFQYALDSISGDMKDVIERLAETQVGWGTQQIQKDIEATLAELVESLKKEYKKAQENNSSGGGGGASGGGQKPPLVPPIAQLKMLKTLEMSVFEKTKTYEEERVLGRMNPVLLDKFIQRLGEKQESISNITRNLAEELEKAMEAEE